MFESSLPETKSALQLIEKHPDTFYLTGSRKLFPSHTGPGTDWDFFIDCSQDLETWLRNNGFRLNAVSGYLDYNLVKVFTKENVDVQLRYSAKLQQERQAKLMALPEETRFLLLDPRKSRDELSDVWNSLG